MRWLISFERGALLNWHHTFKPAGCMPVLTPALRGKPQPKQKAEERAILVQLARRNPTRSIQKVSQRVSTQQSITGKTPMLNAATPSWGNSQREHHQPNTTSNSSFPSKQFLRLQSHGNSSATIHRFTTMWIFNTAAGAFHAT